MLKQRYFLYVGIFPLWTFCMGLLFSCGAPLNRYGLRTDIPLGKNVEVATIKLENNYIKPEDLKPKLLFTNAIFALETWIEEMQHEISADQKQITITLLHQQKTFPLPLLDNYTKGSTQELGKTLHAILNFIKENVPSTNPDLFQKVEYSAIRGIFAALDPHSQLEMDQTETLRNQALFGENFHATISYPSLGMTAKLEKLAFVITQVSKKSPADQANLQIGDEILQIDSYDTKNLLPTESEFLVKQAVKQLALCVKRPLSIETRCVTLQKKADPKTWEEPFVYHTITSLHQKRIAYFHIKDFTSPSVFSQFKSQLQEVLSQDVVGLVLDLRDNQGGLTWVAEAILILLQKPDRTIHVKNSNHQLSFGRAISYANERFSVLPEKVQKQIKPQLPLTVLINQHSASAAELLAGGLKSSNRALVIGLPSFGKGSAFVKETQPDGTILDITNSEYLIPHEQSIQRVGVIPDIFMNPAFLEAPDSLSLHPEVAYQKEKNLTGAFVSTFEQLSESSLFFNPYIPPLEEIKQKKVPGFSLNCATTPENCSQDEVAKLAFEIVSQTQHFTRTGMLKQIQPFLQNYQTQTKQKLYDALQSFGIDFTEVGPQINPGKIEAELLDFEKPPTLEAGATLKLRLRITNTGAGALGQVRAQIHSTNTFLNGKEWVFGKILPGDTIIRELSLQIPAWFWSRTRFFKISIFEEHQSSPLVLEPLYFNIKALTNPQLVYRYRFLEPTLEPAETNSQNKSKELVQKNSNLVPQGRKVRLQVFVQNQGAVPAKQVGLMLENLNIPGIIVNKGFFDMGDLQVREEKSQIFEFVVSSQYKRPDAWFRLVLGEIGFVDNIIAKRIHIPLSPKPAETYKEVKVTPPSIEVEALPVLTLAPSIKMKAHISHPEKLYDLVIFVKSDEQLYPRKVKYQRFTENQNSALIEMEIPLQKGEHLITIQTRHNEYEYQTKVVSVTRLEPAQILKNIVKN